MEGEVAVQAEQGTTTLDIILITIAIGTIALMWYEIQCRKPTNRKPSKLAPPALRHSEIFEPCDESWSDSRDLKDYWEGDRRFLSIVGNVFDVTNSEMYLPGMTYHALLGRDASRAFGLMSTEEKDMLCDLEGLGQKQLDVVYDWVNYFRFRKGYPLVGKVPRLYQEVPESYKYKPDENDKEIEQEIEQKTIERSELSAILEQAQSVQEASESDDDADVAANVMSMVD